MSKKEDTAMCYYCPEHGVYWDYAEQGVISVCKEHLQVGLSS